MKKRLTAFLIFSVLLISITSAGLIDSLKGIITGEATSQPTNVSINVVGTTQVTVSVDNSTLAGGVNPVESSSVNTVIYVKVCDADGVNDINDSATDIVYLGPNSETRNGNCSWTNDIDSNCANFTCSADLWYFDTPGAWIINASGNDLGNKTPVYNSSSNFTFNQLKALVISPTQLNWSSLTPGSTNVGADNDPSVVNNTGNYNGTIDITAYDLYGKTTTTEVFASNNFTADVNDPACSGNSLPNATLTTITGSVSNPGNLSAGGGAGQEQIYYCIPLVPSVSSQEYTTDQSGSWIISY